MKLMNKFKADEGYKYGMLCTKITKKLLEWNQTHSIAFEIVWEIW